MSTLSDTLDAVRELVDQDKPRPSLVQALTSELEGEESGEQTDNEVPAGDREGRDLRSTLANAYRDDDGD